MRTDPMILICAENGSNSLLSPIICSPTLASSTGRGSTDPTVRSKKSKKRGGAKSSDVLDYTIWPTLSDFSHTYYKLLTWDESSACIPWTSSVWWQLRCTPPHDELLPPYLQGTDKYGGIIWISTRLVKVDLLRSVHYGQQYASTALP